jgi:hypothetical protein
VRKEAGGLQLAGPHAISNHQNHDGTNTRICSARIELAGPLTASAHAFAACESTTGLSARRCPAARSELPATAAAIGRRLNGTTQNRDVEKTEERDSKRHTQPFGGSP